METRQGMKHNARLKKMFWENAPNKAGIDEVMETGETNDHREQV